MQTSEKKSNCSNLGTVPVSVLVFILALVPSLGLEPKLGLVSVVFRYQSQLGTSFEASFSSSCSTDQEIEPGSVPGFTFRVGPDGGLRMRIPPGFLSTVFNIRIDV
jgi:hypothetical protein